MVNVAIVAGGATLEREVSLRSARRLATVLKGLGHHPSIVDLDSQLLQNLAAIDPEIVWPLVHGSVGEDGSLQDLLEISDFTFVGTGAQGCRLATSKPVAKSVVAKNGLSTPISVALPTALFRLLGAQQILRQIQASIGLPVVVKPAKGGSGFGITIVRDAAQLPEAMANAFAYGDEVLIEQWIEGTQVAVSIISDVDGARALPLVEIDVESDAYNYDARYSAGDTNYFVPARISAPAAEAARRLALECHRVLELNQLSRIDLIVDAEGTPWFIDANVVPGMTDTSLFPLAAENGPGFAEVCDAILREALELPRTATTEALPD